jgi:putative hemolysin
VINTSLYIATILLVIVLDLLFAAARSAFVNCRISLLIKMEEEGRPGATRAIRVASEASRLLVTLRIGQGAARLLSMGLLLSFLAPYYAHEGFITPVMLGLILLTAGLILGLLEFFIENLTQRAAEESAIRLAPFVAAMAKLLVPVGWALYRIAGWITRTSGEDQHLVTEEEIMTLVDAGEEEGVIEEEEKEMIYSIFQLDNTLAREVMIPRIDMEAFSEETSLEEATETLLRTGHSRAPVYQGSVDNIIGLIYIKDLLSAWNDGQLEQKVTDLLRPAYFVPEAKTVDDLLAEMRARRMHMAVVVDEYGGTAGIVTIEDIVEEIVGEILDEYDFEEELPYQELYEGEFLFSGGIDLDDVNQITGAQLPKDTSETLGGFIYGQLGKVPATGESVKAGGLNLVVEEVSGRRISKVRAELIKEAPVEIETNEVDE